VSTTSEVLPCVCSRSWPVDNRLDFEFPATVAKFPLAQNTEILPHLLQVIFVVTSRHNYSDNILQRFASQNRANKQLCKP